MITPLSDRSGVADSRPIVGEIARRRVESRHTALEAGAMLHDELARMALAPDAASAATPRDELALHGLCRCGGTGEWELVWM